MVTCMHNHIGVNAVKSKPETTGVEENVKGTPIPQTGSKPWHTVYNQEMLPPALIQAAIRKELDDLNQHVWSLERIEDVQQDPEHKLIRMRFVNCNTGDEVTPDVCARLACQ